MDHPLERYALRPARLPQEWSAYHAIRRDAIFSALLPGQAYDEHDPDKFQASPSSARARPRRRDHRHGAHRPRRRDPGRPSPHRHPPRFATARPRQRPAQACRTRRARPGQDRDRHQCRPDIAELLSRQWLSRRRMARRQAGAGKPHSGGQAIVLARAHVPPHADAAGFHGSLRRFAYVRLAYVRAPCVHRNRGRAVALLSWNARLRRVCESKRVPSPRLRFHSSPNRRRVNQQPQGQLGRNSSDGASTHPIEEVKRRRGLTIAALMAGFVTMSTLPAAAQGWGYEGWGGPPRGFGISIGFRSPYYGNWGYGYAAPAAYAYSAPAGYAYSAP